MRSLISLSTSSDSKGLRCSVSSRAIGLARSPSTAPREPGRELRFPSVLTVSMGFHGLAAWALVSVGAAPRAMAPSEFAVSVEVEASATVISPEPISPESQVPTQPPAPTEALPERHRVEPTLVRRPSRAPVARADHERADGNEQQAERDAPAPLASVPSVDEVFGAGSEGALTVEGASSFAAAAGRGAGAEGGSGRPTATGEPGLGMTAGAVPDVADRRRARRAYVRSLEGLLGGRVRYPRAALRERLTGRAELCLRIGQDGRVLGSRLCASTGHELLDAAALEAASELERVPAPPLLAAWTPSDEIHAGVVFLVR